MAVFPPPDEPLGILFLCDPKYADLMSEEDRFNRRMDDADRDGVLYLPMPFVLQ